jgi:phosphoglucosamine mutase
MTALFGTDGIRGRAGQFPLDPPTLPLIGRAIGERLGGLLLIGRDPRESGPQIFESLRVGLEAGGASIQDAGIIPTPAIALLTRDSTLGGGIMISASHNPFKDNGIKVFGPDGRKIDDQDEARIEARVAELQAESGPDMNPSGSVGSGSWSEDVGGELPTRYLDLLRKRFPEGKWLEGLSLTLDCANGAMSGLAPAFLESLGARVDAIHSNPDGININVDCGAVHPESLVEAVGRNGSDLGVAYDGDGDRSMFVDSTGRIIDGDGVLLVMARLLEQSGNLEPKLVVGTSMTNYNLERKLQDEGIGLLRVDVGDRFIFRKMLESGACLGGEPSGHLIFPDFRLSGDGLLSTLKLCQAMTIQSSSLEALTRDWQPAPHLLENVRVSERIPLDTLPPIEGKIDEIRATLKGRGRIVVRYSGTELLLRVMVESDSNAMNRTCADELIAVIEAELGASGPRQK